MKPYAARLKSAKAIISSIPEGRDLLALADDMGIDIRFDGRLKRFLGLTRVTEKTITLNPGLSDKKLVNILLHELRHVWQSVYLPVERNIFLRQDELVALNRLKEGDAIAHSALMVYKINAATGLKLPIDGANMVVPLPRRNVEKHILKNAFNGSQKLTQTLWYDKQARQQHKLISDWGRKKFGQRHAQRQMQRDSIKDTFKRASVVISAGYGMKNFSYLDSKNPADFVKKVKGFVKKTP